MPCTAMGYGPDEQFFLTDALFWSSIYESALDELIMAPIQGARDTYAACSEGRIGRCAYGVIDTACEVGKVCDGVRSWVSIAKDVRGVAKSAQGVTKTVKTRPTPGRDGATSEHVIERTDGEVTSVTHRVTKDGEVLHQHQTHVGRHGTERRFPDEWIEYPTVPKD